MDKYFGKWRQLDRQKQVVYIIAIAAVLALCSFIFHLTARPQFVALYTNMDPNQAAPLVNHLRDTGVPYRLTDFGTTLKVPQELVYELRIDMAGKGMPFAQGMGFELFDESPLGMTDFERQVQLQRALQEELRRTITALDAVMQARVHLALPEPRVFLREQAEPSAAVYLKLNPLVQIREEQITGIVHLVASSVENLKPQNITLIDAQGMLLYDGAAAGNLPATVSGDALQQLEVQRNYEKELEQRIETVLERVFGPGGAMVLVNAEMDFDARELATIRYETDPVPRSIHVIQELSEGTAPAPGEVGEANIPGYVAAAPGGAGRFERSEEITNYEVGQVSETVVAAPGRVLRLHTSVVVDEERAAAAPDKLEQVNALVASAIGFNAERGDQISVQGMSFDTSVAEEMEIAMAELAQKEQAAQREQLIRQAVTAGAVLLALLLLFFFARRGRRREPQAPFADVARGATVEEVLAARSRDYSETPDFLEDTSNLRVKEMFNNDPDASVAILRTWLAEEK